METRYVSPSVRPLLVVPSIRSMVDLTHTSRRGVCITWLNEYTEHATHTTFTEENKCGLSLMITGVVGSGADRHGGQDRHRKSVLIPTAVVEIKKKRKVPCCSRLHNIPVLVRSVVHGLSLSVSPAPSAGVENKQATAVVGQRENNPV